MEVLRGNVVTPYETIIDGGVVVENGLIAAVLRGQEFPSDISVTHSKDAYILPGFVDIHNHGGVGRDFMDATHEAFSAIAGYLAEHGVTTALAATTAAPVESILACLRVFREYRNHPSGGCRLWGIHLEGPFLSVRNRGAHPEAFLRTPRDGYDFVVENADVIKIATVAPELEGMIRMIRSLRDVGIVTSGGHDDAAEVEIKEAIDAGMRHTTHIYCAMSTLPKRGGVRQTGLCEAAMTDDRLTTEMIADNHHVPPTLAKMIYRCKGVDRVCLVSDCIRAGGMSLEEGQPFKLGAPGAEGQEVVIVDGIAMVPDKTKYAGSVQSLDRMIAR